MNDLDSWREGRDTQDEALQSIQAIYPSCEPDSQACQLNPTYATMYEHTNYDHYLPPNAFNI